MDLTGLNEKQQEAVLYTEGQLLILAGAGSGKTTVLVNRLAYILESKNVRPGNILAITFTNKAAREMRERVIAKIGSIGESMWIATFHSACVRMLRNCIERLGYNPNFVIYDEADTKTVLKDCMKELNLDERVFPLRMLRNAISNAKDNLMDAQTYEAVYSTDYRKRTIAEVYDLYQKKLKQNNALDFDDIVFNMVRIFAENPDILEDYRNRFHYIMVDEYQDTSNAQYMLISLLAGDDGNICVVGDDDQSIYRFRGANIQNILNFESQWTDAKVIKLEQNYRSTPNILNAANAVIEHNRGRKGKNLWTAKQGGDKLLCYTGYNEQEEARFIASQITERVQKGAKFSDFAILYRTNAQSRVIEEMLLRMAVPYRILAGLRFYDRKEIKDIVAYLRVILNPEDGISLKRIINEPKRGIGTASMEKAENIANDMGVSLFEVIRCANEHPDLSRAAAKMVAFADLITTLQKAQGGTKLTDFVTRVMNESGYVAALELENTVESRTRIENLNEFLSAVADFEKDSDQPTLSEFSEGISLVSDLDAYDEDQDACVLMTVHSSKGLEFPVVFLTGMEEGLFPSARSMNDIEDIEEERRLCYVAITRAKQLLYITQVRSRTMFGKTSPAMSSRFFKEIPEELIKEVGAMSKMPYLPTEERKIYKRAMAQGEVYQKPVAKSTVTGISFTTGNRVKHPKFGEGVIMSVTPFEKDALLEINFEKVGSKRLMAAYAKLEKLEG